MMSLQISNKLKLANITWEACNSDIKLRYQLQMLSINNTPFCWIPKWNRNWKIKCKRCNKKTAWHKHHIYYDFSNEYNPLKTTISLCVKCHQKISKLNQQEQYKLNKKLTKKDRLRVWNKFYIKSFSFLPILFFHYLCNA